MVTIEGLVGRPQPPAAAGVGGRAGQPVRLLRAGLDHGARGAAQGQPQAARRRGRRRRQHLPLRDRPAGAQGDPRAARQRRRASGSIAVKQRLIRLGAIFGPVKPVVSRSSVMRSLIFLLLLGGASVPALSQDRDRSGDDAADARRALRARRPAEPGGAGAKPARRAREERSQAQQERREQRDDASRAPVGRAPDGRASSRSRSSRSRPARRRAIPSSGLRRTAASVSGYDIAPRQREVRTIPQHADGRRPPQTGITDPAPRRDRDGRRCERRSSPLGPGQLAQRPPLRLAALARPQPQHRSGSGSTSTRSAGAISRWGIGSRLYPNYYRSSFWINDPWMYRLPQAYRAVPLGALSQRRAAGRHVERRSGRRHLQLLLVELRPPLVEIEGRPGLPGRPAVIGG